MSDRDRKTACKRAYIDRAVSTDAGIRAYLTAWFRRTQARPLA